MQPIYVTVSASGSPGSWRLTNWQATPFQASFAVIANSSSSFNIDATFEDPTGVYPNPNSSSPTAFSLISSGSTSQFISLSPGSSLYPAPIAAYRYTVNTISSVGGKVQFIYLQAGIG
jgi:hypothetical protein